MRFILFLSCIITCSFYAQSTSLIFATRNSQETVEWIHRLIDCAKSKIEISGSYFAGTVALDLVHHISQLLEKEPELSISLLYSPVLFQDPQAKNVLSTLCSRFNARIEVIETPAVWVTHPECAFIENHVKYVLVDGCYFSLGGTNLAEAMCTETPLPYSDQTTTLHKLTPRAYRDQDIVGKSSSLVEQLRNHFYQLRTLWLTYEKTGQLDYNLQHYTTIPPPILQRGRCRALESDPRCVALPSSAITLYASSPFTSNPITTALEDDIAHSKKNITFGSLYFDPPGNILPLLIQAVKNHRSFTLITNGVTPSISATQHSALYSRFHYRSLLYGQQRPSECAGIQYPLVSLFEYAKDKTFYHKKIYVFDEHITYIGSYNLGKKSALYDFEIMVRINSVPLTKQILHNLSIDQYHSHKITHHKVQQGYYTPWKLWLSKLEAIFTGGLF